MALINCPECGKEVSDTANVCIHCGYGIKDYFIRIKQQEEAERKKIELENKKEELRKKIEERLKTIQMPPKPRMPKSLYVGLICVCLGLILPSFVYRAIDRSGYGYMINISPLYFIILFLLGVYLVIRGVYRYLREKFEYNSIKSNFKAYQQKVISKEFGNELAKLKQNTSTTQNVKMQNKPQPQQTQQSNKPQCPYCHSYNIVRVTNVDKAVNTAVFGILGQKRKYQWHCNNCKTYF